MSTLPFDTKKSILSPCCSEHPHTGACVTARRRQGRRGVRYKGWGGHEKGMYTKRVTKCFTLVCSTVMGVEGTWTSCLHALPNPSKAQWNHLKLKTMWLAVKPAWHTQKHELQQGHKPWKHNGHGRLIRKHNCLVSTYTLQAITAVAPAIAHSNTTHPPSFVRIKTTFPTGNNELSTGLHMDLDLKNSHSFLHLSCQNLKHGYPNTLLICVALPLYEGEVKLHSTGPPIKMYSYTDSLQRWNKHHLS